VIKLNNGNMIEKVCAAFLLWATAIVLPAQTTAVAPTVTFTTLHSFDGTDGVAPHAVLVQGTDGNFYGTTYLGGTKELGTVFKITPSGALTTPAKYRW
jgi:uncharacterized repeat protein (TIGR03803 family)